MRPTDDWIMQDWLDGYAGTDDPNERYALLRQEMTRLREAGQSADLFDREAVAETVGRLNDEVEADLVVFVANDFGLPMAYRPEAAGVELQDAVRRAILERKYDDTNDDLAALREELLDAHPGVHKAIVAALDGCALRYHLPEGSSENTNFLTVREMVGLVDYTTNSAQRDGLTRTY